jgi:hypothetical protein
MDVLKTTLKLLHVIPLCITTVNILHISEKFGKDPLPELSIDASERLLDTEVFVTGVIGLVFLGILLTIMFLNCNRERSVSVRRVINSLISCLIDCEPRRIRQDNRQSSSTQFRV